MLIGEIKLPAALIVPWSIEVFVVLRQNLPSLIVFIAICFAVSAVGGLVTATSVGGWYQTLQKPAFNPPDWLFGPVWAVLYLFMAIAGWRVWCREDDPGRKAALTAFAVQLFLNLLWSFLFFGLKNPGLALLEIFLLVVLIAVTTVLFWRIDRIAGALFLPYLAWVSYATLLNAALWTMNTPK
ncbi:MAG: TspO/MBR family protein [Hyphomicrobiales bacterium]